jgi:hypothetical protein
VSLPAGGRIDLDLDFGRYGWSDPSLESFYVGVQLRVLHRSRKAMTRPRGFVIGASRADGGLAPAFGYSLDLLATRRARLGVEVTTGGSPNAGPRMFAKVFVLWRAPMVSPRPE